MAALALAIGGAVSGLIDFRVFLAYLVFMILCNAVISLTALFIFVRDQAVLKTREIAYFILLIFLEFFWYRWLMTMAKLSGTINYLRGVRSFDKYQRQQR